MGCLSSHQHKDPDTISRPHVFFVLGGPGSGKGTQCQNLVRDYKFKHLSVGDLLRDQRDHKGPQAQLIDQLMKQGKLVPSDLAVKLIRKAIAINGTRRYLVDGFPRNQQNLQAFKRIMKDQVIVKGLIFFHCSNEVMRQRILGRAKTSGRVDDNQQSIKLRLKTFETQTLPVLQQYQKGNNNCIIVNAEQTPQKVYADLKVKLHEAHVQAPAPAEVFFVLGGPGSGKGTQCEYMVKQYGFRHLSTGDLLRQAVKYGTPKGKQIDAYMKEGKLVSSELLIGLVKQKMERYNYGGRYLLDGFPRGQQNIDVWNKMMLDSTNVRGVFYFECDEKELVARLLNRGKTSGRIDDNEETIKKRIKTFNQQTAPVIATYGKAGRLIKVSAMQPIEKVSADVKHELTLLGINPKKPSGEGAKLIPVIGGPGSGKGTQCDKLKQVFGFKHISTGDLLREQQKNQGLFTDLLAEYMKQGKLVPSQLLIQLMRKAIYKMGNHGTILIDGFPRNQQNIDKWNQIVGSEFEFRNMIYFECSQQVMADRLLERGKTSGRADDNTDTIKKRLQVFNKQTRPVANKLDKPGFSIKVNADKSRDEVFNELRQKLLEAGYKTL